MNHRPRINTVGRRTGTVGCQYRSAATVLYVLTAGARQFGGFYEMTSSNWTYRVEDPASKEIGEPAAAIMVVSANNQLNALDKLARDTGYAFISDTENADPNQSVSAKIF